MDRSGQVALGGASLAVGLWATTGVAALLSFALQAMLARSLSPGEYGELTAALAGVNVVAGFVAGFATAAARDHALEGRIPRPMAGRYLAIGWACALAGTFALAGWWTAAGFPDVRPSLVGLALAVLLATGPIALLESSLQVSSRPLPLLAWQPVYPLLRLVAVAAGFRVAAAATLGSSLVALAATGVVVGAAATLLLARRLSGGTAPAPWRTVWVRGWPFGAANLAYAAYLAASLLAVSLALPGRQVGVYGVAMACMTALLLMPGVLGSKALVPAMRRWAAEPASFGRHYRRARLFLVGTGVVAAGAAIVCAPLLVPLVFGDFYAAAVRPFQVLAVALPFRFAIVLAAVRVMVTQHPGRRLALEAVAAALLFGTSLLVAPRGLTWVAAAFVAHETVLAMLLGQVARRDGHRADGQANRL